jgi:hypothetical protein
MISTAWIYNFTCIPMLVYCKRINQHCTQFLLRDVLVRLYGIGNLRQLGLLAVRNVEAGALSLLGFVEEFGEAVFPIAAIGSKTLRKCIGPVHKLSIAALLISGVHYRIQDSRKRGVAYVGECLLAARIVGRICSSSRSRRSSYTIAYRRLASGRDNIKKVTMRC